MTRLCIFPKSTKSTSGNMLSTVDLEVAKPISPELSWKAVTKGRRSRKTVARNLNDGMKMVNRSPKRVGDFSGSDSDKIGEASHFSSERVEHVPIKKRRHLLRSSPPQSHREESSSPQSLATPPMPSEDTEQIPVYNHSSDRWSSDSYSSRRVLGSERKAALKYGLNDKVVDAKLSKASNKKIYSSEDFSGIALLAAAACFNGFDDEPGTVKETHDMVESSAPGGSAGSTSSHSRGTLAFKESTDPSTGYMVHASNTETSTVVNETASVPKVFADFEEPSAGDKSVVSPKVPRMLWDLNTSMDAWEQPPEDPGMENTFDKGSSDGAQKEEFNTEICDNKRDFEDNTVRYERLDQNGAISESAKVSKPDFVSVHDRVCTKEILFGDLGTKALDSSSSRRKTHGEFVSGDALVANSCSIKPHNGSCVLVSGGLALMTPSDSDLIMTQSRDSHVVKAAACIKGTSSVVAFPEKPDSDPIMTSEVPAASILNPMGVRSFESNPTGCNPLSKCEDLSFESNPTGCNPLSKCEDLSAPKVTENQCVAAEPRKQLGNILAAGTRLQSEGKELVSKFSDSKDCNEGLQVDDPSKFSKIALAFEESHNSDISQEDRSQSNDRARIEAGYDSPFEDGELRGSIMYSWVDNEIEDGENECVDYESDGRDGVGSDAADHPASEIVEGGSEGSQSIDKRISSTSGCPEVDFFKGRSPRNFPRRQFNRDASIVVGSGGKKGMGAGSGSTTYRSGDKIEGNEGVFRKFEFNGPYMEENGSMTNRGKPESRVEGPLYFDATDGRRTTLRYQSRPHNPIGSYHRPGREVSPNEFFGRYRSNYNSRDRGARDGQWNNWNSRNSYQPVYHGSESNSYSRRRSYADSADKFDGGLDSRDHRQSINYSEGVRRQLVRRRSSVERGDSYDVHKRTVPVRGGYRSRGGAGNFSQRFGRGMREEGYEPVPREGDLSCLRVPQYLPRRGRSGSPTSGRGGRISVPRRRGSRSRSRTRSPHPWPPQRGRNFSTRRRSRSPDGRMERMRMPFRKPGFTASYGEDFSSPTRGQFPPEQRSSRWVDERSFTGEVRHKWSPMKVVKRGQRFDPPIDVKSDECRPVMRPGRFESMGRGRNNFESNYDEKRRDSRYEMMHRVRDADTGVEVRRFEPDAREGFEAVANSHTEEDLQRDVPRSAREDDRTLKA